MTVSPLRQLAMTALLLAWLGPALAQGDVLLRPPVDITDSNPPECVFADEPALLSGYDQWAVTVLDTRFVLPAEYVPPDLVVFEQPQAGQPAQGFQLRALVIDDLKAVLDAARVAGTPLALQSAYRSFQYQADTFAYWVGLQGEERALQTSARPGHSEHQLGTAIDFRSEDGPAAWDVEDWALEPAGAWLAVNAWRFGFVMSYPQGSRALSCYTYEPWHYRYVGRELAAQIHASGLVPRVALWRASLTLASDGATGE